MYAISDISVVTTDSTEPGCPQIAEHHDNYKKSLSDTIPIGILYYHTNSETTLTEIEPIKLLIQQYPPSYTVLIKGHADKEGNETFNMKLSQKRVEHIVEFFKNKLPNKIQAAAFGDTLPFENKINSLANRRVEVLLVK